MLSLPGASAGMSQEVPAMRISGGGSGNINVLQSDSGQYRNKDFITDQNGAFQAGTSLAGAAGKYTHSQIINPADSGITTLIDKAVVALDTTGKFRFSMYDTELSTAVWAWRSRKNAGAAGKSLFRWEQNAGVLGTLHFEIQVTADVPYMIHWDEPIELAEGEGCVLVATTVNVAINTAWFGREV